MIDSHCHLAGDEFATDLEAVVARAAQSGVGAALCIVGSEDDAEMLRTEAVRRAWPAIRFATGVHPHHAGKFAAAIDTLADVVRRAIDSTQACAIGEIGLDYHYDFSPREVQQEVFRRQVRLARALAVPVIIHTREAWQDTVTILREEGGGVIEGVFHCFSGDRSTAKDALELGFYLSYAGILTFPKAEELREAARLTPIDRLLAETDSPYLAPVPHRGKRNEPAFVGRVVETLATLHQLPAGTMAERISANFHRLFGLAR